jgi:hypothetical protein
MLNRQACGNDQKKASGNGAALHAHATRIKGVAASDQPRAAAIGMVQLMGKKRIAHWRKNRAWTVRMTLK